MFWLALVTGALTLLILWPPRRYAVVALLVFSVVLPVAEFIPFFIIAEAAYVATYARDPWLIGGFVACWVLLFRHYVRADVSGAPFSRYSYAWPIAGGRSATVVFDAQHRLKLDVWRPATPNKKAIIYVHGGGWVVGHRMFQGRPFMLRMTRVGYTCFSIDYRLSPRATFPAHIIDVKRAIAWVREHAAEYGIDPEQISIAGNSAGGHLAALAALTPGLAEFQPGFETARTDVHACLCFYGIYDLEDLPARWPHRGLEWLWHLLVLKQSRKKAPLLWQAASPAFHLKAGAPPFFLAHGTHDTLVPIEEARAFAVKLRQFTRVEYVEIPGAQHAFELALSPRARMVVGRAERFLQTV